MRHEKMTWQCSDIEAIVCHTVTMHLTDTADNHRLDSGDSWVFKLVPSSLCLCSIVTHNRTRGCRRQLAAAGDSCWAPRRISSSSSSSSVQTAQHPLSSSVLNATYWAPLPTRCARACALTKRKRRLSLHLGDAQGPTERAGEKTRGSSQHSSYSN